MPASFELSGPVSWWNESLTPCDRLKNVLVTASVVQPGQADFGADICNTAIWASGAAIQPLRVRLQMISDRCKG